MQTQDLEGDGEGREPLGKEPDNGVEGPHDDRQPCDLAVELDHLRVLTGDDGLAKGAGKGVDDRQEHGHAEEEPEPLHSGDN